MRTMQSRLLFAAVVLAAVMGARMDSVAADAATNHDAQVRLVMHDLSGDDSDARLQAKLRLLRPENRSLLKAHSAELIAALRGDWQSDESARILGQLDLPSDLASQLRNSDQVPDVVRARLGNALAEQRVIAAFENAKGFGACHEAAAGLAYVESPGTLQAFARGLASRELITDVHGNEVSEALLLIQAYGQQHPEEPLFDSDEYLQHANVTPEVFKQPEHQLYLRQLEARLAALYQIHVTIDPPILLNTDKVEKYR